ncbi:MAG TPA: hypothetical protein PKY82_02620 [Pyrinomonadaceae bacterium]|nr:hypothetical protein [Pyrinomonadaceae bacterium]
MEIGVTQRWKHKKAVYQPLRDYFNPRHFEITEIGEVIAKDFVTTNHYTNAYPVARKRFGLFEKGNLVGVAVYSHPMSEKVITNVFQCEKASDGLELGRLVLLDTVLSNAESFFVAECHRRLKKLGFVGVVSFSDDLPRYSADGKKTFAGHLGIVYQSLGASFLNRSSPIRQYILPDGTNLSKRTISKIRNGEVGWEYSSRILENFGADKCSPETEKRKKWLDYWLDKLTRRVKHPGNLRYAWSFNKKIELKSLPYPKIRFGERQIQLFGDEN